MNRLIFLLGAVLASMVVGILIGRTTGQTADTTDGSSSQPVVPYWVAPMDPNYRRDEPGKSPMGMDLVPVYDNAADGGAGLISIDPTIVNNLGVRTAEAELGVLSRRIDTVGYVDYDEDTVHHVHTRVEGWIENLVTKATGDPVSKGQLLFEIYSPTLVGAQEEFLTAQRSENDLLISASAARLAALGVDANEIERLRSEKAIRHRTPVYAESNGIIAHLGVREGIFVTPATEVMSVAELDRVWVMAEVFERQAAWVEAGQSAIVEFDYLPGQQWNGVVDYVYPELDPKTRTLTVRLRFENTSAALRPNMFSRVTIFASGFGEVVHVPREAVIRGGSVDRVVVALGEGRFRSRPVTIGIESGDRIAIRRGLSAGDLVVVSGQFLIDSESNIASAFDRMDN